MIAMGPVQDFTIDKLLTEREQSGDPYLQFLKVPSVRMGIYALAAGEEDKQSSHDEDEVYYVLRGRAVLRVGTEEHPVAPGSLVFVAAHEPHRFHSIQEALQILVFFSSGPPR